MAGHQVLFLMSFCLHGFLFSEAAKILTISTIDFQKKERAYQVIYWSPPKDQLKKASKKFEFYIKGAFDGRAMSGSVVMRQQGPVLMSVAHITVKGQADMDLENFTAKFGDSGFIFVSHGSLLDSYQTKKSIKEMNNAFAHLPQGVIWKFKASHWPKDVKLAENVKIVERLPQNDLLAHPRIRLFVTHGGISSVTEAIQHGVPIVRLPVNFDQPYNMVQVETKMFGISIQLQDVNEETLVWTIKQVMEEKRYQSAAMAARVIGDTQPLPPAQKLVGWIDHILKTGGAAHLKPYVLQRPWHGLYFLDIILFFVGVILGTLWLCGKVLGAVTRYLSGAKKMKKI
ncbi:LOW QUALITY PROTEIN: UDP-glucuronosyltransferase 3A2-like [Psammomys obesus]|uniref:LOW QUALITY PROTEIN: UDP-glucuronosyltransferase 3A2-like n=1 Tax=Psammomys obesus TaxID=48139 RepID=UPI0024536A36|nr:LOW QUALITY PROTEIN: UDP-glucuronosyltransferase 3A2-like [Psammomys obesus]